MDTRAEMKRQAQGHAVSDYLNKVTRLQVTDDVYDQQYWADYNTALAAIGEASSRPAQPPGYRPQAPPVDKVAPGTPHADPRQAAAGWREEAGMYQREDHQGPAGNSSQPADRQVPLAMALLDELRQSGEWAPGTSVTDDYRDGRMQALELDWVRNPPGWSADGPEAG